jgi:hypothetical protein
MTPAKRFLVGFVAVALLLFALACAALSQLLVSLVFWSLANCGEGPACIAAAVAIDYWWIPFIAIVLLLATGGRAIFLRLGRARGLL